MFVFHIMLYNIRWYPLVPPQILQFAHAPRKIPSIAFSPMVSSMCRASSTAVCCMDEVCSSVGTILANNTTFFSFPCGCIHTSPNLSLQNPPKRTASTVGPLHAFLANPAIPPCLLVSCAEVVQVERTISTQNHPFIPPHRCTPTRKSSIS